MSDQFAFLKSSAATRVIAAMLIGMSAAACSSDVARFSSDPFANPFSGRSPSIDRDATGSISRQQIPAAPDAGYRVPAAAPVTSRALTPPAAARSAPVAPSVASPAVTGSLPPVPAVSSRAPSAVDLATSRPARAVSGAVAAAEPVRTFNGWSSAGGTPIVAGSGDSVNTIASRYGVPAPAIMATNGLSGGALRPGQQLVIPVFNAADASARRPAPVSEAQPATVRAPAPVSAPAPAPAPSPRVPVAEVPRPAAPTTPLRPPAPVATAPAPRAPAPQVAQVAPKPTARSVETTGSVSVPARVEAPRAVQSPAVDAARERAKAQAEAAKARAEASKSQANIRATEQAAKAEQERKRLADMRLQAETDRKKASEARQAAEEDRRKLAAARAEAEKKRVADARKQADEKKAAERQQAEAKARAEREQRQAQTTQPRDANRVAAAPAPQATPATPASPRAAQPNAEAVTTGSVQRQDFRWPVRGRVIGGFSGRGANEGINIAVPEGTPVKAAGDGVVAYAGNELKGYGNLVLIRHDNGYVSAYAHNGDLNVRRGEKVSRGQIIARSGQSGNVSSPQLHFEIRKGSNPVDPMPYLNQ